MTTADSLTPALLPPARLAEIRANGMRALDLIIASNGIPWPDIMASMDDRRDLLAHLAALTSPTDRESGGRLVREVWIAWAKEQPAPKASWLVEWEGLSEPDREVDRRIFEACAARARAGLTGPLPADGGEALGAATYAEFESAEKHNFPLCRTKTYEPWESMPARMRDVYRRIAIALYQRGFAAGRSEGEAIGRAQRETAIEIRDATIDGQAAEIARLTEELAIVADRMKRAEGAQAQLDRALASCETYRAEIERLTSSLRTEVTIKEQAQDELVATRLKRREEWERAERLTAELAEARAQRDYLKRREEDIIAACERVADGGQYRADIVSAIQSLRRDRDAARLSGAREEREAMASHVKAMRDGSALHAPTLNTLVHWLRARDEGGRR